MPAIAVSADGQYVFMALENGGSPLVFKAAITDLSALSLIYDPGAGSAVNVAQVPSNPDKMLFYGNFGTDVTVISHTISTEANADISPASLGANIVNALDVNPEDEGEIWITVNGNQDLLRTTTGGASWTTKNSALGLNPTALKVAWPNSDKLFVAGLDGTVKLLWSTNGGTSFTNQAGSALGATANITNIELVAP